MCYWVQIILFVSDKDVSIMCYWVRIIIFVIDKDVSHVLLGTHHPFCY